MIGLFIAALALQAAQGQEWTEADRRSAVEVAKALRGHWRDCLVSALGKLGRSNADPETIVVGTFGSCTIEEQALRDALETSFRGLIEPGARPARAAEIIRTLRGTFREEAIAKILTQRLPTKPTH